MTVRTHMTGLQVNEDTCTSNPKLATVGYVPSTIPQETVDTYQFLKDVDSANIQKASIFFVSTGHVAEANGTKDGNNLEAK